MSKPLETITILQASMILITAIGIVDHVIILPALLQSARRDAWVSTLLSGILFLCWIPLILYIMRKSRQQHLFVWLKEHLGALFTWVLILISLMVLFTMSAVTLRDVSNWTHISYLPETPNWVIVSSLSIVSFYVVKSGLKSIAIVNGLLLPIVILLGFFVATSTIPHKDYTLLFPLFEHGYSPVARGMVYASSGFVGIMSIVFMQHRIRSKMGLFPLFVVGLILILLTFGPLTGVIAIFGPDQAARIRFPAYEEWRMVTFGHYLEHVDFLSIYQWLVGSFIQISLGMFLIPEILNIRTEKKRILTLILLFVYGPVKGRRENSAYSDDSINKRKVGR